MPEARNVRLSPEAISDLDRLDRFLRERNPAAADRMLSEVYASALSLRIHAARGARWQFDSGQHDVRELLVLFGRQAYVIRYQILDDAVRILRIHHSREDRRREAETP